ncbi:hypothetical protein NXX53_24290 [Bacteroides salyersiae]|nr:hypothetical protein [Bacteroides salyersiae]
MMYTQYGNKQPIERHYDAMKRWLKHMREEYMTEDFILTKDKYGDWCLPPESLELIHSRDPERKTDGSLIATAYYLKMLQLMHRFASVQGLEEEARQWGSIGTEDERCFQCPFLDSKNGNFTRAGSSALSG